jgi:hypothetical protein
MKGITKGINILLQDIAKIPKFDWHGRIISVEFADQPCAERVWLVLKHKEGDNILRFTFSTLKSQSIPENEKILARGSGDPDLAVSVTIHDNQCLVTWSHKLSDYAHSTSGGCRQVIGIGGLPFPVNLCAIDRADELGISVDLISKSRQPYDLPSLNFQKALKLKMETRFPPRSDAESLLSRRQTCTKCGYHWVARLRKPGCVFWLDWTACCVGMVEIKRSSFWPQLRVSLGDSRFPD